MRTISTVEVKPRSVSTIEYATIDTKDHVYGSFKYGSSTKYGTSTKLSAGQKMPKVDTREV